MGSVRLLILYLLPLLMFLELGMSTSNDDGWTQFKIKYKKRYNTEEDNCHRKIYNTKLRAIRAHNRLYLQGKVSYWMRLNEFSDSDHNLLFSYRRMVPPPLERSTIGVVKPPNYKTYNQIRGGRDWRKFGIISPVGTQGHECLSCWAFSTTGVLEAHLARRTRRLVPLSPKHLMDCVPKPNEGCRGGWVSVAFNYTRTHGIATLSSYPYEPKAERCRQDLAYNGGFLRGHVTLNKRCERELAEVVYNVGPVAVSIHSLHQDFEEYGGGVLRIPDCPSDKIDLTHSVLVVGFDTDPTWGDYWLIKNSYGKSWGESGYFRLARNAGNMCGVASLPQYPIV
ncbi:crustapain-like [Drosophila kikkawai]|uniref:Crustapain-like n=1 Tax=Drosophila kikkawai TaxID=30033 RepID=A0ABM3C6B3_DROKI|nr:procathepsin L-like [Drosophila kikkawai]